MAADPAPKSAGEATGLSAIDCYLTDEASAPPGYEGLFSEQPWWLQAPGYAYRPAEGMGEVSALLALQRGEAGLAREVEHDYRLMFEAWAGGAPSESLDRPEVISGLYAAHT